MLKEIIHIINHIYVAQIGQENRGKCMRYCKGIACSSYKKYSSRFN